MGDMWVYTYKSIFVHTSKREGILCNMYLTLAYVISVGCLIDIISVKEDKKRKNS